MRSGVAGIRPQARDRQRFDSRSSDCVLRLCDLAWIAMAKWVCGASDWHRAPRVRGPDTGLGKLAADDRCAGRPFFAVGPLVGVRERPAI
jgi:hypothetical protein